MATRLTAFSIVVAVLFSSIGLAAAGDASKQQRRLNQKAVEAMVDGDYPLAIELLEESLAEGELNVTYLNLGRAYAKSERCKDALQAYDKMAVAPRVSEPSPEELYEILTRYRAELIEECPGNVIIRCNPSSLGLSIDGGGERNCPNGAIELSPGEHSFTGLQRGEPVVDQTATVEGMATVYVDLVYEEGVQKRIESSRATTGGSTGGASALDIVGYSSLGLGVAFLVSALVVDNTVIADNIDAFDRAVNDGDATRARELQNMVETTQTVNLALYITGGSLAALGATLVIVSLATGDTESAGVAGLSVQPDGSASVTWTKRF